MNAPPKVLKPDRRSFWFLGFDWLINNPVTFDKC